MNWIIFVVMSCRNVIIRRLSLAVKLILFDSKLSSEAV